MSLTAEIELRRFNPDLMVGRKNRHRRSEALKTLFEAPVSSEYSDFIRKVRLAQLMEREGRRPHAAWRIVIKQPGFRYEPEDYLCSGGRCGHGVGGD